MLSRRVSCPLFLHPLEPGDPRRDNEAFFNAAYPRGRSQFIPYSLPLSIGDVHDKKCAMEAARAFWVLALVGMSLPISTAMELKFLWCGTKLQSATQRKLNAKGPP